MRIELNNRGGGKGFRLVGVKYIAFFSPLLCEITPMKAYATAQSQRRQILSALSIFNTSTL